MGLGVVALLGLLVLTVPVLWATGAVFHLSTILGAAATVVVWAIWALIVVLLVLTARGMWRRAG